MGAALSFDRRKIQGEYYSIISRDCPSGFLCKVVIWSYYS